MIYLNNQMNHILYHILKINLSILSKKYEQFTCNPPIKLHINQTENRITFKIKTGYSSIQYSWQLKQ